MKIIDFDKKISRDIAQCRVRVCESTLGFERNPSQPPRHRRMTRNSTRLGLGESSAEHKMKVN